VSQPSPSLHTSAFTLLGFEPALELEEVELKRRFEHLRTQFHPDRFSQGSALERRLAVQRAADINAAFATLSNPLSRAQLYFEWRGITLNEARSLDDAAFLIQQMEWREALEDARDNAARHALQQQIKQLWAKNWAYLRSAAEAASSATMDAALIQAHLQRLQFLQRFIEHIQHTLTP